MFICNFGMTVLLMIIRTTHITSTFSDCATYGTVRNFTICIICTEAYFRHRSILTVDFKMLLELIIGLSSYAVCWLAGSLAGLTCLPIACVYTGST